ncbi:hypothetical protein CHLRE_12g531100v5 [Chlamydomonas reinhardtii]|uniref:proteasome endopeptidase complex n=1 Tax=Chlamydomonas reinhardtii TaxID=3055 RepID=A8IVY4_CHLRE|nr:uncharacterized protein CHLRE_12g531100v5 [Chlamydomonas reinhardtii]XP_042918661.1 uncharacterized protein CHLRE_12g531100v5 [Chlamydomonas reinhardtii]PNW75549.1 hypothetical protein CHLRE_12g531100v5 [Chlamydomonas reinhardtii]PNW75550.1 hypothetical protein CHLRE_12g531100v5 [Chlamydomonas reinhardtii]|eukprot:XP_001693037.1 20S proteasome beta subunit A2 [Chlamydomonas reinhardtii]
MHSSRGASHAEAPPSTGTTIVACTYKGGVVLGADGRVSIGNYIMNRASNKIAPLAEYIFLCRSGSAPDTQVISDNVKHYLDQISAESGEEPSVEMAANLVKLINYNNKDHLVGAMLIAGWDRHGGGQVYGAPIGGTLVKEKWAIDGSGSTYIWGYCDNEYRDDMTREEAEKWVAEAIALAMTRDSSSGGSIRLITLDGTGAHHKYIRGDEVQQFVGDLPFPAAPPASLPLQGGAAGSMVVG